MGFYAFFAKKTLVARNREQSRPNRHLAGWRCKLHGL